MTEAIGGPVAMIAVDWGTSSFRAYLMGGDGGVCDMRATGDGILTVTPGAFGDVLWSAIGDWHRATDRDLPVVMSGMVGSRQGWVEAPYVTCPATVEALAGQMMTVAHPEIGWLRLVPGLVTRGSDGRPDVIRGEETQVVGALASQGARDGRFLLPGTHSKWVTVTDGAIIDFSTYMTGEVFGALMGHTILGRMTPATTAHDRAAFVRGVTEGAADGPPGAMLNRMFGARTRVLVDQMPAGEVADYLSGLLIGAELSAGAGDHQGTLTIVAGSDLAERYAAAAGALGIAVTTADPNSAATGAFVLARTAGLIGELP